MGKKMIRKINNIKIFKEGNYNFKDVQRLKDYFKPKVIDIYQKQLKELFEIKNPQSIFKKNFKKFIKYKNKKDVKISGDWIYYPWSNTLIHTLSEQENYLLRTNRNQNIITAKEQKKLRNFTVAIAGLSVGGNIATTLIYNGFSKNIKLADFDTLSTTNLNRVKASLKDIGRHKIDIIKEQIMEIDPYIKIYSYHEGLNKKNLQDFIENYPRPKLIFEVIDDFKLKILIRKLAKKNKIPVVMLTNLGDNVLIDIERYDIEPDVKFFNGKVNENILNAIMRNQITEKEKKKYAIDLVGKENLTERVINSVLNIGKTLVGRPQVMSTVAISSGIAALIARKIALEENLPSGRSLIKFDEIMIK